MRSLIFALTLASACEPEDEAGGFVAECVDTHPATGEGDFESDMWHIACVQPAEGDPVECDPPTRAEVEAECAADGHDCTGVIVVSKAAALCIASADGLDDGLEGLYADLIYNYRYHAPIWAVSNVIEDDGTGRQQGESLDLSAASGEILDHSWWSMTP